MRYRIEMSQTRKGFARVNFPGRILGPRSREHVGSVWVVGVTDLTGSEEASVTVRAEKPEMLSAGRASDGARGGRSDRQPDRGRDQAQS